MLRARADDVPADSARDSAGWRDVIERFRQPSMRRATWQILDTFIPYVLTWYLMYLGLHIAWWLIPPLIVLAAGLLLRIFIIFHDCTHGSFFRSGRANDVVGCVAGVLTFTPFFQWRSDHAIHHATAGHLDKRGTGDIWTMTVREYRASSWGTRTAYRLARNPVVLFLLAPLFVFGIRQRVPVRPAGRRERQSIWWTNLALVCVAIPMCWIYGVAAYASIQLAVLAIAGSFGIWMFYVQHQFENVYWERGKDWDYVATALEGSSFYKLPKILQWFSASIGFHHVHHLSARVPNYNLQKCHDAHPLLQRVPPLSLRASLKTLSLRLWDEKTRKLVGYRQVQPGRGPA